MNLTELFIEYERWLDKFEWDLFCTLRFKRPTSPRLAKESFRKWISQMQDEDGTRHFSWFCVTEGRGYSEHIHLHALVGGLVSDSERSTWMLRWSAGECFISYFRFLDGGILYLFQEISPFEDLDIDFDLEDALPRTPKGRR